MGDIAHGEWWRVDQPQERVSGALSLVGETPELCILGQLTETDGFAKRSRSAETVPLIHGRTVDGDSYTLVDSWQRGLTRKDANAHSEILSPQATLRGAHLDHHELLFDRMLLGLHNIEAFADDPHIQVDTDVGDGGWPVAMTLQAERTVYLEGDLGTDAVRLVSAPEHGGGGQRSTLGLDVYFEVVPAEPSDWSRLIEEPGNALSDLTTLALTHPAAIRMVQLHSIAGTSGPDRVWVELLLPFRKPRATRSTEGWLASFHKLFSASDAPEEVISRWTDVTAAYSAVVPLVFAPAYAPFIYSEHRFISVSQAIEALHDRLHGSQALPIEEHRARVKAVLAAALPAEHADWVAQVLQPANSLPFVQKVERILADCPPVAERVDTNLLARQIASTRNPLSHGALRRAGMLDHVDRHWAAEVVRFSVSWYLLLELGMPADEATKRVARHLDFRHAVDELPGT